MLQFNFWKPFQQYHTVLTNSLHVVSSLHFFKFYSYTSICKIIDSFQISPGPPLFVLCTRHPLLAFSRMPHHSTPSSLLACGVLKPMECESVSYLWSFCELCTCLMPTLPYLWMPSESVWQTQPEIQKWSMILQTAVS